MKSGKNPRTNQCHSSVSQPPLLVGGGGLHVEQHTHLAQDWEELEEEMGKLGKLGAGCCHMPTR